MRQQPEQFLIEGIDRLGKSTLIEGLLQELGYHLVVHYEKPKKLKALAGFKDPLLTYQVELYSQMFQMIKARMPVIFDRAHLGELVYAPMYRKYDTDYVLQFEKLTDTRSARLVLLTTSDFSFLQDDGLSIDFSKKEEEQAKFIEAFNSSSIQDKVLVDVSNGHGGYRSAESILAEVLRKK
jgi:thymidylate kinase